MLAFHLGLDSGGPDNAVFSLQEKRKRGLDNRNEPAVVRNSITWGLLPSGNVHKLEEEKEGGGEREDEVGNVAGTLVTPGK